MHILTDKRETDEFRLLRDLFKDYDKEVRPVYKNTDVVNVQFSLSLIQIISVVSATLDRFDRLDRKKVKVPSYWLRQGSR